MLGRVRARARADGLDERVVTHLAELPGGLTGLEPADLAWASLSLHHIGDEARALEAVRQVLLPGGFLAVAELGEELAVLPAALGLGRPGFVDRLERAAADVLRSVRSGSGQPFHAAGLPVRLGAAGFEVVAERSARIRIDAPLSPDARRLAFRHLDRLRPHLPGHLEQDDLDTLGALTDPDEPRGVLTRPDVFIEASRQMVIARRTTAP